MTLSGQANDVVRNAMHSLAWKIPALRFEGIADAGNSYYYSNWGGTGLMFGKPNLSPKPLYVAVATMTQMLGGTKFSRIIPTGNTTVYAFEFKKPNGGFVTCLWTPNASRKALLTAVREHLQIIDIMGNPRPPQLINGKDDITITSSPQFVESKQPLKIYGEPATKRSLPDERYFSISALNNANDWKQINSENDELQAYNFMQPRQAGSFAVKNVAAAGKKNVLEIKSTKPNTQSWWIP